MLDRSSETAAVAVCKSLIIRIIFLLRALHPVYLIIHSQWCIVINHTSFILKLVSWLRMIKINFQQELIHLVNQWCISFNRILTLVSKTCKLIAWQNHPLNSNSDGITFTKAPVYSHHKYKSSHRNDKANNQTVWIISQGNHQLSVHTSLTVR